MTTNVFDARSATDYAVPMMKVCASLWGFLSGGDTLPRVEPSWSFHSFPVGGLGSRFAGVGLLTGRSRSGVGLKSRDHVAWLSMLHPDERLTYLSGIGFSDEELGRSAEVVERWLDVSRRQALGDVSRKACEAGEGLDWVMDEWERTRPYEVLSRLISESSISQPVPAVCYAVCTAVELALSMLILHELDAVAEPVSGVADAQWAAEDEWIASLDLFEDVSKWPE